MKKILIFGAAGYVGLNLVQALRRLGYHVIATDIIDEEIVDHIVDVRDEKKVLDIIKKTEPNFIIDLAAKTIVDDTLTLNDYEMNWSLPIAIRSAEKVGYTFEKILFTSTQFVLSPKYSNSKNKFSYAPHTTYGVSKVLYEQYIIQNIESDFLIFRPTNVWGRNHQKYNDLWLPLLRKGVVAIPKYDVMKSYVFIDHLVKFYVAGLVEDTVDYNNEARVVYATDNPTTQENWVSEQVAAQRKLGYKYANFFKVPVNFLFLISFILTCLSFFTGRNPLPRTRVHSMLADYRVPSRHINDNFCGANCDVKASSQKGETL